MSDSPICRASRWAAGFTSRSMESRSVVVVARMLAVAIPAHLGLDVVAGRLHQRLHRAVPTAIEALHRLGSPAGSTCLRILGRADARLQRVHRREPVMSRAARASAGSSRLARKVLPERLLESGDPVAHALHGNGGRALSRAVDELLADAAAQDRG
jgi:hypothetical protein